MEGQRLDKWLYCARLAKTRSGAARLMEEGQVRVDGETLANLTDDFYVAAFERHGETSDYILIRGSAHADHAD